MALWAIFGALVVIIVLLLSGNELDPDRFGIVLARIVELLEANQEELKKIRKQATGESNEEVEADELYDVAESWPSRSGGDKD